MTNIEIIKATIKDIDQLQKIGKQTFLESFGSVNTEENMQIYLDEKFSIANLTSELKDKNATFYFAKLDHTILGYLKLNIGSSPSTLPEDNALEIERIYVLSDFQGKNVGQLLFQKAIQIAKQLELDYIWLGVWEENNRAINFYKKNGFVAFDKHLFKLGNDLQTDWLMKLILNNK